MNNYKFMKVFDCHRGMPEDVRESFFDIYRNYGNGIGNDCFVEYTINGDGVGDDEDHQKLDAWLIANGAEDRKLGQYNGETVIIKHWW